MFTRAFFFLALVLLLLGLSQAAGWSLALGIVCLGARALIGPAVRWL